MRVDRAALRVPRVNSLPSREETQTERPCLYRKQPSKVLKTPGTRGRFQKRYCCHPMLFPSVFAARRTVHSVWGKRGLDVTRESLHSVPLDKTGPSCTRVSCIERAKAWQGRADFRQPRRRPKQRCRIVLVSARRKAPSPRLWCLDGAVRRVRSLGRGAETGVTIQLSLTGDLY